MHVHNIPPSFAQFQRRYEIIVINTKNMTQNNIYTKITHSMD